MVYGSQVSGAGQSSEENAPATRRDLATRRIGQFTSAMLPIAVVYDALFVVSAIAWRSIALAVGGIVSVTIYVIALVWARRELARKAVARAALLTGSGLLVMISIGAVFLHFQFAALVLIAVAAVVVVLPHISQRSLASFAAVAVVVIAQIVVLDAMLPPLFEQPPLWFQRCVLASSLIAAAVLIMLMLSSDHERMSTLVVEAHGAREATETFLVAAAHQLRTPVSTVLLQSETLLGDSTVDPGTKTRLERVVRQATRLQHVVDAMLDASRASAGTLQLDRCPLDLALIVRDVARDHARAAADAGVVIDVDAPPSLPMEGDPQRLALVTSNLLANAIKFGGGTSPRLTLRDGDEHVEISVLDAGPGMSAAERDRCFERAAAPSSRADGSLGTGLWLVRKLAQAMGGDVAAEAGLQSGIKFSVRIPRSRA